MAVRFDRVQGSRNHQRHIDRRYRVHVDRAERRPVLRHRGPDAQAARFRGRPTGHQVHRHRGRDHMVPGHRLRHARGHVLVPAPVPGEQRDRVRGLLPVPRGAGPLLSQARRAGPVSRVLHHTAVGHRVLLRHDGQTPDTQYQKHARRSPSKFAGIPFTDQIELLFIVSYITTLAVNNYCYWYGARLG